MKDFLAKIDAKQSQKQQNQEVQSARQKHYEQIAVSFAKKFDTLLSSYLSALEKRGYFYEKIANFPYYKVEIEQCFFVITHQENAPEFILFSSFHNFRKEIIITDILQDKIIIDFIEDTLERIV